MKLSDLRRLAVRHRVRVSFPLSSGLVCTVGENGICTAPGLAGQPPCDFEQEFAAAKEFRWEAVAPARGAQRGAPSTRVLTREHLIEMSRLSHAGETPSNEANAEEPA